MHDLSEMVDDHYYMNRLPKYVTATLGKLFNNIGYFWIAVRKVSTDVPDTNRKSFNATIKKSIQIVNMVERKFDIPLTTMFPAKAVWESGAPMKKTHAASFKVSKRWLRSPSTFSAFLLFLRCPNIYGMIGVKTYSDIFKIAKRERNQHGGNDALDAYWLDESRTTIEILLPRIRKLLPTAGGATKKRWDYSSMEDGIYSLAEDVEVYSRDKDVSDITTHNPKLVKDIVRIMG